MILEKILQLAKSGYVDFEFSDDNDLSQENLNLFHRILVSPHVSFALLTLQKTKILHQLIPEFSDVVNLTNEKIFGQHKNLFKEIWPHTIQVVSQTPPELHLRWAALFHDLGKAKAFSIKNNKVTFHKHEYYSAKIFSNFNQKTRIFTKHQYNTIYSLIKHLGYVEEYDSEWSDSAIRRIGTNLYNILPELIELSKADITTRNDAERRRILTKISEFKERVNKIRVEDELNKSKLPKGIGLIISQRLNVQGKNIGIVRDMLDQKINDGVLLPNQSTEYYLAYLIMEEEKCKSQ